MTEQEENELICERLLGWERCQWLAAPAGVGLIRVEGWRRTDGEVIETPSFTDWASAGLILEALDKRVIGVEVGNFGRNEIRWYCDIESIGPPTNAAATGPLAVRAAALAYLREGK